MARWRSDNPDMSDEELLAAADAVRDVQPAPALDFRAWCLEHGTTPLEVMRLRRRLRG